MHRGPKTVVLLILAARVHVLAPDHSRAVSLAGAVFPITEQARAPIAPRERRPRPTALSTRGFNPEPV
jgi:hypothetical protein